MRGQLVRTDGGPPTRSKPTSRSAGGMSGCTSHGYGTHRSAPVEPQTVHEGVDLGPISCDKGVPSEFSRPQCSWHPSQSAYGTSVGGNQLQAETAELDLYSPSSNVLQTTLDRLGVTLECPFAPSHSSSFSLNLGKSAHIQLLGPPLTRTNSHLGRT